MSKILHISVVDKIATYQRRDGDIVCGNSDYQIHFTFDQEWESHTEKTARFVWGGHYYDVPFTGDTCDVPILHNTKSVKVGVYAGDLSTTTPATIHAKRSILCSGSTPSPEDDRDYASEAKKAADRAEAAAERAENAAGQGGVSGDFSNALKGTTSGGVIDDMSPVAQDLKIEVEGMYGYSANVYVSGKNLMPSAFLSTWEKHDFQDPNDLYHICDGYRGKVSDLFKSGSPVLLCDKFSPFYQYTFSLIASCQHMDVEHYGIKLIGFYFQYSDGTTSATSYVQLDGPSGHHFSITSEPGKQIAGLYAVMEQDAPRLWLGDLQLELGANSSEYELFKEIQHFFVENINGENGQGVTIEGVKPFYPTTTVVWDTFYGSMNVEYSRDINKAFNDLKQAIIALGGTV